MEILLDNPAFYLLKCGMSLHGMCGMAGGVVQQYGYSTLVSSDILKLRMQHIEWEYHFLK